MNEGPMGRKTHSLLATRSCIVIIIFLGSSSVFISPFSNDVHDFFLDVSPLLQGQSIYLSCKSLLPVKSFCLFMTFLKLSLSRLLLHNYQSKSFEFVLQDRVSIVDICLRLIWLASPKSSHWPEKMHTKNSRLLIFFYIDFQFLFYERIICSDLSYKNPAHL